MTVTASDGNGNADTATVVITVVRGTPGVTVTPTSLRVFEGTSETYTVVLDAPPSGPVTITLGGASGDVTVNPGGLSFTPSNWSAPQTVRVSAAPDRDSNTDPDVILTHRASGGGYDSVSVDQVTVSVIETNVEIAKPVLTAVPGDQRVTLVWDAHVLSGWIYQYREAGSGDQGWKPPNWRGDVPGGGDVTSHVVTGLRNGVEYEFRIRGHRLWIPGPISNIATATPSPGLTLSRHALRVVEGGSATYKVALDRMPPENVKVVVGVSGDVTAAPDRLTFTPSNWSAPQTVKVSAGEDGDTADDIVTLRHTATGGGFDGTRSLGGVEVTVRDTTPGDRRPELTLPGDPLVVTEGEPIIVKVLSDRHLTGKVSVSLTLAPMSSSGFDAADIAGGLTQAREADFGSVPGLTGTVSIATLPDSVVESIEDYSIRLNDGAGYRVGSDRKAPGSLKDNTGIVSMPSALTVTEGTDSARFTVTASRPFGRTIAFHVSYDRGTATGAADPADGDYDNDAVTRVVFGPAETRKDIVIPLSDDGDVETDETIVVVISPVGAFVPTGFVLGNRKTTVTIADDDTGSVTVTPTRLRVPEGGSNTYTVVLDAKPWGNVTVTPSSTDRAVAMVSGPLTFTASDWSDPQTVTVRGVHDTDPDASDASVTVSHAMSGGGYTGVRAESVAVTVTDDDAAADVDSRPSVEVELNNSGAVIGARARTPHTVSVTLDTVVRATILNSSREVNLFIRTPRDTVGPFSRELGTHTIEGELAGIPGYISRPGAKFRFVFQVDIAPPTLVAAVDRTVSVPWGQTVRQCFDLLAVKHGGTTYLERRAGRPAVSAHASLLDRKTGIVMSTSVPGIAEGRGLADLSPCVDLGPGVHRVTWVWRGPHGETIDRRQSTYVTVVAIPAAPRNLSASPGPEHVSLAWSTPPAAAPGARFSYQYRQKPGSGEYGPWTAVPGSGPATVGHRVTGLAPGVVHTFQVRAVDANGAGVASSEASAMLATRGVTVGTGSLTVREGGSGAYTVVLDAVPSGPVTVTPSSGDRSVAMVSGPLTFTAADWSKPQTVTVTGVRDEDTADEDVVVSHAVSGGGYAGVRVSSVTVTVTDTTPVLTLPTAPAAVVEGRPIVLTVASDRPLTGGLRVNLTLSDPETSGFAANDVAGGLTQAVEADFGSGGRTATVSIPTVADISVEGTESYLVTLNDGPGYAPGVAVVVAGELSDAPRRPEKPTSLRATASEDRVTLTWTAQADPSIRGWQYRERVKGYSSWLLFLGSGVKVAHASAGAGAAVRARTIDMTREYSSDGSVKNTVRRVYNGFVLEYQIRSWNDEGEGPWSDIAEVVTVNADSGATVIVSRDAIALRPGDSATWSVAMNSVLAGKVSLSARGAGGVRVEPSVLTFAGGSGQIPQEVTVTGLVEGRATIVHAYTGLGSTAVNVANAAEVAVTVTRSGAISPVRPAGFTATAGDKRVVLRWSDPGDATIATWQLRQRRSASNTAWARFPWTDIPSSDKDTVSHTVTGLDGGRSYDFQVRAVNAVGPGPASATRSAVPTGGASVTVTPIRLTVDEGGTGSFTIVLNEEPTVARLRVEAKIDRTSPQHSFAEDGLFFEASTARDKSDRYETIFLTFTPGNWNIPQKVTLRGLRDRDDRDDPITVVIDQGPSGGLWHRSNYRGIDIPNVTVTIRDASPALQLLSDPAPVTEGTPVRLTVTADRKRTGTLPVNLTLSSRSFGGFDASDIPGALTQTFEADFGSTPSRTGTVSIPTLADADTAEGAEAYAIRLNPVVGGYTVGDDVTAEGVLNDGAAATRPARPTGLAATAGDGAVALMWDDPQDATITGWQVRHSAMVSGWQGASWTDVPDAGAGTTTHRVTGLVNDRGYRFQVRAVNPAGSSLPSDVVVATPNAVPCRIGLAGLDGGAIDAGRATVSFQVKVPANCGRITDVRRQVKTTAQEWSDVPWTPLAVRAVRGWPNAGAARTGKETAELTVERGRLDVRVRAFNQQAAGPVSETAWAWFGAPDAPTGFTAAPGDGQVTLTWNAQPDQGVTGWRYTYRPSDSSEWTTVPVAGAATTTTTVTGLTNGTQYLFHVRAVGHNWSDWSAVAAVTPVNAPPCRIGIAEPRGSAISAGAEASLSFRVKVPANCGRITDIQRQIKTVAEDWDDVSWTPLSTPGARSWPNANTPATGKETATLANAQRGRHDVRVRAFNEEAGGQVSETAWAWIGAPDAPSGFAAAPGDGRMTLTWDAQPDQAISVWRYRYRSGSGPWVESVLAGSVPSSFTITGLINGTEYVFQLRAEGQGPGAWSAEVKATPAAPRSVWVPRTLTVAEDAGAVTVTVTASEAFGQGVAFNVTYGGTATGAAAPAEGDYDNDAVTEVTFSATETEKAIVIPITNDDDVEGNETFTVSVTPAGGLPDGWTLGNTTTTVTIADDDRAALAIADVTAAEGATFAFTVTASPVLSEPVGFKYKVTAASGDTAAAGEDFTAVTTATAATIAGGEATATITVAVTDDSLDEDDETFTVTLSEPSAGVRIGDATARGTITDNDEPPALAIAAPPAAVTEGDSGSTDMAFTVTLDAASGRTVTVNHAVAGTATATAGTDFTGGAGTLSFAPGETTKSITLSVTGDETDEADETVVLTLSNAQNATIATPTASATITDDDASPVLAALTALTVKVGEEASLTARASDADNDPITYAWRRTSGPTLPSGATLDAATLRFTPTAPGAYAMTVTASDGKGNADSASVTITVNPATAVSVPRTLGVAENAGTADIAITTPAAFGQSVAFAVTYGGAATGANDPAEGDYDNDAVTEVTFNATDKTKTISVPITDDVLDENNETFTVTIALAEGQSLPRGFVLGNTTTTVTITDDDTLATTWTLSLDPATLAEASATTQVTLTATRAGTATALAATEIAVSVAGGTATAGEDFTAVTGFTLTVAPGATTGTADFNLAVTDDARDEADETLTVTGVLAGNTITPARLTITDNDEPPALAIAAPPAAVTEGDSGSTDMAFTVTLDAASGRTVTVNHAVAGTATATAGTDFTGGAGTLSFAPGETTKSITLSVTGDETDEADETVVLTLSNAQNATIATPTASATITDDDASPVLAALTALTVKVGEEASLTARASDADNDPITYAWRRTSGPTLPSGATLDAATLRFTPTAPGAYAMTVTASDGKGNADSASVTITVNPATAVSVPRTLGVAENAGTADIAITTPAAFGQSVAFAVTYGGAATGANDPAEGDYDNDAVTEVTFNATDKTKTISVPITDDVLDENNETFTVTIALAEGQSLPRGFVLGNTTTTVTITDDDTLATTWTLSLDPATLAEASATTQVTLTATRAGTATALAATEIAVSVAGGTATAGEDFTAVTGFTLTVAPGATTGTADFNLAVTDDARDEADETLTVTGVLAGNTITPARLTITDNDEPPALAIAAPPAAVTEGDSGSTDMAFTVTLDAASGRTVTVNHAVAGTATATAGTDFTGGAGTLSFAPGETTKSITLSVTGDETDEADETVVLTLSNAQNATIATPTASATITDDDASPVLAALTALTVKVGEEASLTARASDADNDPITYAWRRTSGPTLPSGATLDAATLRFTPTAPGAYAMTVTASDGKGNADSASVTITVNPATAVSVPRTLGVAENAGTADIAITTPAAFGQSVAFAVTYGGAATGANDPAEGDYDNDAVTEVTFNATDKTKTISVPITDDVLDENNETFTVTIALAEGQSLPRGFVLGNTTTTVTITDDDTLATTWTLSLDPATLAEASATTQVTLTATRAGTATALAATEIAVSVAGGTATAGEDFTAVTGFTLTVAPGATTGTADFNLAVTDDARDEADETLTVTGVLAGNTITPARLTITDNDEPPALAIAAPPAAVTEGDSGSTDMAFTVTLDAASGRTVTVNHAVAGTATATAGTDFTGGAGTLSFAPGETTKSITLSVTGDETDEADETVVLTLSNAQNATIATPTASATITDDDASPVLAALTALTVKVGEEASLTARASDADNDPITYAWRRTSGPTLPSGATLDAATLRFTPTAPGAYAMTVTASDGKGNADSASVTITVNPATAVSVPRTLGVAENAGTADIAITTPAAFGQSVAFAVTYGGAATGANDPAEGDYDNDAVTEVTFNATDKTKTISVPITDDVLDENNETFTVTIALAEGQSLPRGFVLGNTTTTVTITDDDTLATTWTLSLDPATLAEASATTQVTLTATRAGTATALAATEIAVSVAGGTATAGEDFTAVTGFTLTVAPGATTGTADFNLAVTDDARDEADETLTVTGVLAGNTITPARLTITDNDEPPALAIAAPPAAVTEGDSGSTDMAFTVTLDAASGRTVTVNHAVAGTATATAGTDFTGGAGTLSFAPGETTKSITLSVTGDETDEADETVVLTLSNAQNATIATPTASATITDDDASPVLAALTALTLKVGEEASLTARASDADNDPITYAWRRTSGPTLPSGATLDAATLRFTPTAPGAYAMTVTASDGKGNADSASVTITVNPATAVSVPRTLGVAENAGTADIAITTPAAFGQSVAFAVTYGGAATGANDPAEGDYDNDAVTEVTFNATDKTKTISVPITDDVLDENNETFTVTIALAEGQSLPRGFVLGNTTTTVTITDDDTLATTWTLSLDPATLAEASATTQVTLTATRAGTATALAATEIAVSVAGGTATAGEDFTAVTGFTLTVAPGATTGTADFNLAVTDDARDEADETLTVTGVLAGNTITPARLTITDNDEPPALAIAAPPAAVTEGDSGSTDMAFTVTLDAASGRPVTVNHAVAGTATATPGTDFTGGAGTLSFAPGETTKSITLSVTGDETDEADETVVLTLSNAQNATIATPTASATITDDDASPVLAALTALTLKVGEEASLTARASDADNDPITYAWRRTSGPTLPSGATLDAATLRFTPTAPGAYAMTVTASDGKGNADSASVTITVNPATAVSVPRTLGVAENAGTADIAITTPAAFGQSVAFAVTYGGAATGANDPAEGDYDNDAVTEVTFNATDKTKTISVPITDDVLDENNETFTVTIALAEGQSLPRGFVLGNTTTTVTITDDDTLATTWTLSLDPATLAEASATTQVTLTATRAGTATALAATEIAVSVAGGTATAGEDFTAVTGFTLTVAPGATTGTADFNLAVTDDARDEADETLTVTGVLAGNTITPARLTITDNDEPPETPDQPSGLVATPGDGRVTLVWSDPQDASIVKWQLRYGKVGESLKRWADIEGSSATTTSHTVTGLENGSAYRFRIRTVKRGSKGLRSEDVTATPSAETPDQPSGLVATPGDGRVTLVWSDPQDASIVKWQLRYGKVGRSLKRWADIEGSSATTTSHTVTGLENGSAYRFRIRTVKRGSKGLRSEDVTATPSAATPDQQSGLVATPGDGRVTLSTAALTVEEGGSATYTVVLNAEPSGNVTVTVGGASGDVRVEPANLTFTVADWSVPQTVTVSAAEDDDAVADAAVTLTHGASGGGYDGVEIASITVTVTENDEAGVTVSESVLTVEEGGSATYTVVLETKPTGDVTVTVGDASGDVRVAPSSLTFTVADWSAPQTVTVSAAEDDDAVADAAVTLTHGASGGGYGGVEIASITVTVTENDEAGVTVSESALTVEEGSSATYTVVLETEPAGDVTVMPSSADLSAVAVSGPLIFTASDWKVPQTVTVTGMLDDDTDDVVAVVSHAVSGGDYDGVTADPVRVTVTDMTLAWQVERANRVNASVLPQVAAAVVSQTLSAVTERIDVAAAGDEGSGSMQFGALPSAPDEPARDFLPRPEQSGPGPTLAEALDGASFMLPLGATEDEAIPPRAVMWGRGGRVSLSGSEQGVSWDGGLWSAQLGADVRLRRNLLAGMAVSWSEGKVDTGTADGGGGEVDGTHETTVTSINPYLAWLSPDGSNLWASVGYGLGEVRIAEGDAPARRADLTQWSAAAGGRGVLVGDAELIAGGVTRLATKGEGAASWLRTGVDHGLAELTAKTTRLRLLLEGSHEHGTASGATLTPALEVGVRHDGGDLGRGFGMEAGAGLTWRDSAAGLTAELRSRILAAHERDRDEWGVSALVRFDPETDGRGTFVTFSPSHGWTESNIGQLFDYSLPTAAADAAVGDMDGRLEAEVGHGFGLPGPGPLAVLTPYSGLSLAESGEQTVRLGTRYRLGVLDLDGEFMHRPGVAGEQRMMLRGTLSW